MDAQAQWHLIQYTADMRRKEPRNIGVAVHVDGEWAVKLFGVDSQGMVNGRVLRRMHLIKEDYAEWVAYYRELVTAGEIERIQRSQRKRPTEFRLISGGYVQAIGSASDVAERMFADLVYREEDAPEPHARALLRSVENVLNLAELQPTVDVKVAADWGGGSTAEPVDEVEFNYGYTNGQLHLMDRLQLHHPSPEISKMVARDFNARVAGARQAGVAKSFVAFYSGEAVAEMGDSVLTPAWRVATAIDVDHVGSAVDELRSIMA